jgi:type IV secretory pathway VirB2 component (pilin)
MNKYLSLAIVAVLTLLVVDPAFAQGLGPMTTKLTTFLTQINPVLKVLAGFALVALLVGWWADRINLGQVGFWAVAIMGIGLAPEIVNILWIG